MIEHFGGKPNLTDHRDYDLHRTFGIVGNPVFPDEYITDGGLWMPNQNAPEPIFNNPPLYYGCTDYTVSNLASDQDGVLYNPMFTDNITGANAKMGYDLRQALLTSIKNGTQDKEGNITKRTSLFNVRAYAPLDAFDAIRYAMISGGTEKRSVAWGCPWYKAWQKNSLDDGIVQAPISYDATGLGWHASTFAGWKTINGVVYLMNKSQQGDQIGDHGWLYFPREVVNAVMAVPGTCTFTVTAIGSDHPIARIDTTFIQWLISNIRNFLGLRY